MDMDALYRLYFRDVFLFLQGLTHSESLAEELTQETFFKALNGLKHFDGRQDIRAWLFTVARNCYYSHCRKAKQTVPLDEAFPPAAAPAAGPGRTAHRRRRRLYHPPVPPPAGRAVQGGVHPPGLRRAFLRKDRRDLRPHRQLGLRDLLPRQTKDPADAERSITEEEPRPMAAAPLQFVLYAQSFSSCVSSLRASSNRIFR